MAEKQSPAKDWLIDSVIVLVLTGIAVFVLPAVSALFAVFSLHLINATHPFGAFSPKLGRAPIWIHLVDFIGLSDFFPDILIGSLTGLAAGSLLRHRKLWLAALPAISLCMIYTWHSSFGPDPYPWGDSWMDFVLITNWLLFLAANLVCAKIMFMRRKSS